MQTHVRVLGDGVEGLAALKKRGIVAVHLITAGTGVLPAFYEKYGFKKEESVILMGKEL